MKRFIFSIIAFGAACIVANSTQAGVVFSDDFDAGASPLWGNERGSWSDAGGVYSAQIPSNNPLTLSTLPFTLTDFVIDVDINGIRDGGLFLRRDANGNGVLLVTGGGATASNGLYWHTLANDNVTGTFGVQGGLFSPNDDVHLRVEVIGNTYAAYLNGSATPATTLVNSSFSSGGVGLYDFSSQTFDNFVLVPEPATIALLLIGGLTINQRRRV